MPAAIVPLITTGISLIASASAKKKAQQAEKEAENLATPAYHANQSVLDYYKKALQKYNTNPTDTAEYKFNNQNIKQGTVQALSSLNKLRSGNVANIIQGQNNSLLKAAVAGEQRKARDLDVLRGATGMKAGEEGKEFQYNQIAPFEKKYNLLTMRAAGERANQRQSTQNAYNNANAVASIYSGGDDFSGGGNIGNIFGSSGSRSERRWNNGGRQWWQN